MSLAKVLMETYKRDMRRLVLVPSDQGRFEVSVDGKLIFSKLAQGRFPEDREILAAIGGPAAGKP